MRWTRRGVGAAGLSSSRPLYGIMAILVAVVLVAVCVACGHLGSSQNIASSRNATGSGASGNASSTAPRAGGNASGTAPRAGGNASSTAPRAGGNASNPESGCPTQGVGGDSIAPVCAATASSSGPVPGIAGPATPLPETSLGIDPGLGFGPSVTGVSPNTGAEGGGNVIVISGDGFTGATQVSVGNASAQSFTVDSDTSITATTPAGTGAVDITVATPAGTSDFGPADKFTYIPSGTQVTPSPSSGLSS